MFREPIYLTYVELIHTTGFIKIMSIIWSPLIMYIFIHFLGTKLKERW